MKRWLAIGLALQLTACASVAPRAAPERSIAVRLHAAQQLNAGSAGAALSLVLRVYKLRQSAAFEQLPMATFLDSGKERAGLGADLIAVKEITLVPNQRHEALEQFSADASHLGIVAFFHGAAPQRWRATVPLDQIGKHGVTIGVHACSLVVGALASMRTPARCQ